MRLTLRTLLAYLDDTLDAAQAKQIGQKVSESEFAAELVERIRRVTRKRSLSVPPSSGPERADANTVAEYLDSDLAPDKVEEIERQALQSEVHLAEIAACHQLLTLILSEPAQVPPTARQRMYALAKGPEVDQARRAPRVASATMSPELGVPDDGETSVLVSHRGATKRLTAAAILASLLIIVVTVALWIRDTKKPDSLPPGGILASSQPKESEPAKPKENDKPAETTKEPEKSKEPAKEPTKEPEMGKEPEKSKETDKPAETPKEPEKTPPPPPLDLSAERRTSAERKEVGKAAVGNLLLASVSPGAPWQRVAAGGPITGVSRLMCLPSTQCEVRLNDAIRLELWGAPVEALVPYPALLAFESTVDVFVPPAGFDADLRLVSGRIYLQAAKPNAHARLRLGDDFFDITFMDEQAEVAVEVINSSIRSGEPATTRLFSVGMIGVTRGKITMRENMKPEMNMSAEPGSNVRVWNDLVRDGGDSRNPNGDPQPQLSRQPPLSKLARDKREELDSLSKRIVKRLADPQKDVKLAVAEVAADQSPWGRVVAIYDQAALDDMPPILDAIDDSQAGDARVAALFALQHWLCRDTGRDTRLAAALMSQKSASQSQADQITALLHGFSAEEIKKPATYALLIDLLMNDALPLRELAAWQLRNLDPDGAAAITYYSTDPRDKRERAQQEWKKRIPANSLPPTKAR